MDWRLGRAKNRFSELINRALTEGPQRVLRRDDAVIVMALRNYKQLIGKKPGFKDFLMGEGPDLEGVDLSPIPVNESPFARLTKLEMVRTAHPTPRFPAGAKCRVRRAHQTVHVRSRVLDQSRNCSPMRDISL